VNLLGGDAWPGFTNQGAMRRALTALGIDYRILPGGSYHLADLCRALVHIQWRGPDALKSNFGWGHSMRAYKNTHWLAVVRLNDGLVCCYDNATHPEILRLEE
jgi:hypothetical protein